ncbi:MAG: penicillin-binding protein activator [Gammaproteobacteria bacterium]
MNPPRFRPALLAAVLLAAACAAPGTRATPGDPDSLLGAAEADLAGGHPDDARRWLGSLKPEQLDAPQQARARLLQVEILLAEDRPIEALQLLPLAGELKGMPGLALRAEADRAQVLFRLGDVVGATRTLVAREKLLSDPAQVAANRELLWDGLRTTDLDATPGTRLMKADAVTRGWVEFATISRLVWIDSRDLQARLAQWRASFPNHPAEALAEQAARPVDVPREAVRSVALLLPLSGSHAAGAEAVRDGFLAAWYGLRGSQSLVPAVTVHDTGTTADSLMAAYRKALDGGAEFLVGPLTREDVTTLAGSSRLPVPVLALNYLDPGKQAPFNLFQWGLAPEDEARQAAERAIADRQGRAVVLVPEGDWGTRVLNAYRERYEALGGRVLQSGTYNPAERDYSEPIRALLALDASEGRHRALTGTLGVQTRFEPRRRDDVDVVFIAARPEQARLLAPQLRFHRTGELPIYATAQVYDGDELPADLNGLRFCDMPWMTAKDGDAAQLRGQLRALFPARPKEYTRLLALGHDAYLLVQLIESNRLQPGTYFPAISGTLSLRADGVITRGLSCSEVRNGALRALDVPLVSSTHGR